MEDPDYPGPRITLRSALTLARSAPLLILVVVVAACSVFVGEPTASTTPGSTGPTDPPTTSGGECVRYDGANSPITTGSLETDALAISGQVFVCAHDVVVVALDDLNEVAVGAQLAGALGAPLLFPHPRLSAEIGRLKAQTVHVIGTTEVVAPPGTEVATMTTSQAVDAARRALGASTAVEIPAIADATTVIETVTAIADGDRVVVPAATGSGTSEPAAIDTDAVVRGLAVPNQARSTWLVNAADPLRLLLAAAGGRPVDAATVAIDTTDLLGHPETGVALAGQTTESIRFVGTAAEVDDWELTVLVNGVELPGGGFRILPTEGMRRYLAFYGHPETTSLGALGEQGPEETLARMQPFLEDYAGDGSQVIPTFEMIASVAAGGPTEDNDYSFEWPIETFQPWIETATRNDGYVILDLQSGRDDFLTQAKVYEELLKLPNVGLALDPEWRLAPDQVHLVQVGRVEAAEVNEVIHWLADLVRDNGLPQKMIIVHQFRTSMIQNRETLEQRPELQLVIQMDGDGTEPQKDSTWANLQAGAEEAFWAWGWKNFFDEDEPGPPTPNSTMGKVPTPVYVSYQ